MSKLACTMADQLKQASIQTVSSSTETSLHEYQCQQVFRVWKENTQTPTYRALRSALDKYSVFCGRNPLVSVLGVCVCSVGC